MDAVNYKRQEALFRQTVSSAHKLFCNCGDPASHLQTWSSSTEGTPTGTGTIVEPDGEDFGVPTQEQGGQATGEDTG